MRFLKRHNIIVVIFPSHTTHVLQPFDVTLASPIKNCYLNELNSPRVISQSESEGYNSAQKQRKRRILAFQNAWERVSTSDMIHSFKATGLVPLDKENLAMKRLILDPTIALPQDNFAVRSSPISGKVATDHLELLEPFIWREFRDNHLVVKNIEAEMITPEMIMCIWKINKRKTGKMFNPVPIVLDGGTNIMQNYT